MDKEFKNRHRKSKTDFSRNRLLNFSDLILFQLNMVVKTLSVELEHWFSIFKHRLSCTKQAFSQARKKLLHTAFIELNELFVLNYYRLGGFKLYMGKYVLIAVDSSQCQVGKAQGLADYFGRSRCSHGDGMPMGRASVMYDVLNRVVIDSLFEPWKVNEHTLYHIHRETTKRLIPTSLNCLYLMDRGYPSFRNVLDLQRQCDHYVIRCSAKFCPEAKAFIESGEDEGLLIIRLKGTKRPQQTSLKEVNDCPDQIETRIVRVSAKEGHYNYFLTNTDFTSEQLSDLYFKRWKIETFYGFLKSSLQLENFTSTNPEGVLQDFYARILTANLSEMVIQEAQEQIKEQQDHKPSKYTYQINRNVAIGLLKDELLELLFSGQSVEQHLPRMIEKVKKYKTQLRPNRNFSRVKKIRSRSKYFITRKNAL